MTTELVTVAVSYPRWGSLSDMNKQNLEGEAALCEADFFLKLIFIWGIWKTLDSPHSYVKILFSSLTCLFSG